MLPRNRNVVSLCYTLRDLYEVVIPRDETSIAQMCEKLDAASVCLSVAFRYCIETA